MMTERGNRHVRLTRPLGHDTIALMVGPVAYVLQRISPEEMETILLDKRKRDILGFPQYVCFSGDVVRVWPIPDQNYKVEFAP